MKDKYFIDTNIIIYSFDSVGTKKQKISNHIIKNALAARIGVVSYQVIQEFINVSTKKFQIPLKVEDCKNYLYNVLYPICEIFPSISFYDKAMDILKKTNYSFYDSLIIAGALFSNCKILYSENFHRKQKIEELMVVNPFL